MRLPNLTDVCISLLDRTKRRKCTKGEYVFLSSLCIGKSVSKKQVQKQGLLNYRICVMNMISKYELIVLTNVTIYFLSPLVRFIRNQDKSSETLFVHTGEPVPKLPSGTLVPATCKPGGTNNFLIYSIPSSSC